MFLLERRNISLNYPYYPSLSGALVFFGHHFSQEDGKYGNRVFAGTTEDAIYGYDEYFDGDESRTFVDGDGSITRCPGV